MSDGDNATWKLIIGVLLVVVLIAAVVVILVTGSKNKDDGGASGDPSDASDSVNNLPGHNPDGTSDPSGTVGAQISVTDPDGAAATDVTVAVGGTLDLTAVVTPDTVTDKPIWTTTDENVVKLEALDDTGLKFRLTGVAAGSATVTVSAGGASCEVHVTCGDGTPSGGDPTLASGISVASPFSKGKPITDVTMNVGQSFTYTATVTPSTASGTVTWSVNKSGGVEIVPDETGRKAKITCVGAIGYVEVTATIDGVSYSFRLQTRK